MDWTLDAPALAWHRAIPLVFDHLHLGGGLHWKPIPGTANQAPVLTLTSAALENGARLTGIGAYNFDPARQEWGAAERVKVLESLRALRARGGGLLLGVQGGSLSEGVDYAGNLLSAVVIVGLPFSPPTLEVEALKAYYTRKFGRDRGHEYAYVYPAINKILQAAGRCIRSERDRAVIVLLESRLLDPRTARCFPPDFPLRPVSDVGTEVRTFFYGGRASDAPCS